MLKDQSLLRRLTWERLRSLDECGVSVVELGGKKDGGHARLFRDKGCHYLALGFEGDLPFDLRTGKPQTLPTRQLRISEQTFQQHQR